MDKHCFFGHLHDKLASRYGLSTTQVAHIRNMAIGQWKPRKEIAVQLVTKLQRDRKATRQRHHQGMLNFMASCTPEQYQDITQITEFDKRPCPKVPDEGHTAKYEKKVHQLS